MSQQLLASDDGGDHGQIHSLPRDDGGGDWASHGGTLHDLSEPTNPLHYAAATGTRADLRRLLKAGEQVQSVDHFGRTALVYAAVADIVQNAEYLLKKGADVDAVDNDGRTPLHWATFHAKTGMIKVLLAHGANPLAVDNEGRSVLHLAQDSESLAVYEAAMQPQPPWDVADNTGRTPLAWAAHAGLSDVVAYLLQHSSVAFVDDESRGPFHWGCLSGDVLTVQKLMAAAGETVLDDADSEGRTPLFFAVASGSLAMVDFVINAGCRVEFSDTGMRTVLMLAAQFGNAELVERLLAEGGPLLYSQDVTGRTALHYAVGQHDCLELLAAAIADTSDSAHTTALHLAAFQGDVKACNILISSGSSLEANCDPEGHSETTPVVLAVEQNHCKVAKALLRAGASPYVLDQERRTLLHLAAGQQHGKMCRAIVKVSNLDINQGDHAGRTAVAAASFVGAASTLATLIDLGANVDKQDSEGLSPLHWAASHDNVECLVQLLEAGAFPNPTEYHEMRLTPYDYAVQSGSEECEIALQEHGGLGIEQVRELAASHIQGWWSGFQTRITLLSLWQAHLQDREHQKPEHLQFHRPPPPALQPKGDAAMQHHHPQQKHNRTLGKPKFLPSNTTGSRSESPPSLLQGNVGDMHAGSAYTPLPAIPFGDGATVRRSSMPVVLSGDGTPSFSTAATVADRDSLSGFSPLPSINSSGMAVGTPFSRHSNHGHHGHDPHQHSQHLVNPVVQQARIVHSAARRDRLRREELRAKIEAVRVIQRAVRKWLQFNREVRLGLRPPPKRRPPQPKSQPHLRWSGPGRHGSKARTQPRKNKQPRSDGRFINRGQASGLDHIKQLQHGRQPKQGIARQPQTQPPWGASSAVRRSHAQQQLAVRFDPSNRRMQIAALTIQLAWRQHIRSRTRRSRGDGPKVGAAGGPGFRRAPAIPPAVSRGAMRAVYGSQDRMVSWRPSQPLPRRNAAAWQPPAVRSVQGFNFAVGTYQLPVVFDENGGRHRIQKQPRPALSVVAHTT
eukprot:m.391468 g.391468  ORF g.391468 m.391468 type:complete len:1015 (-) comp20081_c0_seq1:111-3155(-)